MADYDERDDIDGIDKALGCLEDARQALVVVRKHEVEESKEDDSDEEQEGEDDATPASKQPKSLKAAAKETRKRYAAARGEKPRDDS